METTDDNICIISIIYFFMHKAKTAFRDEKNTKKEEGEKKE